MSKLTESAQDAPHCFYCFLQNPNRDLLCLAHDNSLAAGRGFAFKTPDDCGAIVCAYCHDVIDGRRGGLSKEAKREMHRVAASRTMSWWKINGYLPKTRATEAKTSVGKLQSIESK
jgi:hypothetical protein